MNFDQFWGAISQLGPNGGNVAGLRYWIVRRTFKNGNVRETLCIQSDNAIPNAPLKVTEATARQWFGFIQDGMPAQEFAYTYARWFYAVYTHYLV
jgi:hypothetical protein